MVEAPRARGEHEGFQLRKRELDGIEVRAVRGEEAEAGPGLFNRRLDLGLFVDGEIVEDHDVARPERRHEHLLDVGQEGGIVEDSVEPRWTPQNRPSIDRAQPATRDRRPRLWRFYCVRASGRKSAATLVRQLRGPHLSTWA